MLSASMRKNEQKKKELYRNTVLSFRKVISAEKLFVRHTENFRDSLELKIGNIAKLTFELGKTRCVEVDALDLELSQQILLLHTHALSLLLDLSGVELELLAFEDVAVGSSALSGS